MQLIVKQLTVIPFFLALNIFYGKTKSAGKQTIIGDNTSQLALLKKKTLLNFYH